MVVEAMAGSMNGTQCIIACWKRCAVCNLLAGYRHTLTTEGVDRRACTPSQRYRSIHMIVMPMGNQDAANATTPLSLLQDSFEVGGIVDRRVNNNCTAGLITQKDGVGARPGHKRWIRCEDGCIRVLHAQSPSRSRPDYIVGYIPPAVGIARQV